MPDDDMPRDAAQERGADEFAAALLATTEIALLISNHVGLAEWDLWARFWVSV
ncbi:hypothetical protein ARZXY2_4699 (plasmid) [Arthrobacter sp. ZXY-2]|nr:hypothetical protein ARZXY2_4699 [Arthrobacter sp. ZXY-2]